MNPIQKLSELLSELPGIGPRQAKRTVYFLLTERGDLSERLSRALRELQGSVAVCRSCFRFFQKDGRHELCSICRDEHRDRSLLMIVSRDSDLDTMEKSGGFGGLYFVLGGAVPILEKEPEKKVRLVELLKTAKERAETGLLKEIIFALDADPEGENTSDVVRSFLAAAVEAHGVRMTALGRGLSTGSELEYADSATLRNALANRGDSSNGPSRSKTGKTDKK